MRKNLIKIAIIILIILFVIGIIYVYLNPMVLMPVPS